MHRHDLDLMAALADGSLHDEDRARSRLTSCEVCRAEYESHRSVLVATRSAEPIEMSGTERAALHRDVLSAMANSASTPTRRSSFLWPRFGYATVALFLVVGLVGVLSQAGVFSNQDRSLGTLGGSSNAVTAEGAEKSPQAGFAPPTTAAATADMSAAGNGSDDPAAYEPLIEQARKYPRPSPSAGYYSDASVATRAESCIDQAGLDSSFQPIGNVNDASQFILVVPEITELTDETPITVIDFTTCQIVHVDG